MKALYHTFGCKLNFAETASLASLLEGRGVEKVSSKENPDIIIVNSCSVTELADKKCRQTIRAFYRKYGVPIIVTGCYAQLKADEVSSLPGVVIVAGSDRKMKIADYIDKWQSTHEPVKMVIPMPEMRDFMPSCSRGDRTRYFLKVQDGCDYFCSYCTIPFARGRSRSASIDFLVEQAQNVAAEGGREIVITGVNIGDFGKGTSNTFFDLIRQLDMVDGIERYRISSIEPNLLTDEIIDFVAGSRSFMPHFHIPLQSGDDTVLQLMRRRYATSLFAHKVAAVKEAIPHAFIGVDLIVGARGETPELFENSRRFVESLNISRLHVFPYSERPGTRALNDIPYVVDQAEKHRRAAVMGDISDSKLLEFHQSFVGDVRKVLVEHSVHGNSVSGFTDNYIKVSIPNNPALYNQLVDVKLVSVNGEEMKGEVV